MAKKGAMPVYETINDYISTQTPEAQSLLIELCGLIKEAVPEAEEVLNYKVPCFTLVAESDVNQQVMMMGSKKHVSFYPFPAAIEKYSKQLKEFKLGKGSVQFPVTKPLPGDLIIEMVRFREEELKNSLK